MSDTTGDDCTAKNRALVEKYPFLAPRFDGETDPYYNYSFTYLDHMPDGWRKAFGEDLCHELKEALVADGSLNDYYVLQVKEKWGMLRWDGNIEPEPISKILDKYERLSAKTCIKCGAPATRISKGWISPLCAECADAQELATVPIGEYYVGIS